MDKVRTQALFETLLQSVAAEPESFLGFSQAESLTLGDFIDDLDPSLSLDWNGVSFQGLPALRQHVLSEDTLAKAISAMPHGVAMQPEQIAAWVGFLAGPGGDVCSGNVIILNQGRDVR